MNDDELNSHELVSALVDGELRGEEFARALSLLEASAEARSYWHACHLAGDVLRARALGARATGDALFVERLRHRLREEAVRYPQRSPARRAHPEQAAANDANWPWKLVAGFASLGAVAVLAWHLSAGYGDAAATPAALWARQDASPESSTMIRDPRLDQLLAAHRQAGGASALQMPAGFLRNATYERPAR